MANEAIEVPYSEDKNRTWMTESEEEYGYEHDEDKSNRAFSSKRRRSKCCVGLLCVTLVVVAGIIAVVTLAATGNLSTRSNFSSQSAADDSPVLKCNGLENLCTRRVDEVMFASVHNAMSSRADLFVEWNNLEPFEGALEAGFRALFLDSCDCPGLGIQLCHTFCSAGYRRPRAAFESIRDFLQLNPNEVLVVEIQVNDFSLMPLFDILDDIDGFQKLIYKHPGRMEPWPTMGELVNNNTRLILFQHDNGDCNVEGTCPPGVLNTYEYAFETTFSSRGAKELLDYGKSCKVSRGDPNNPFVISNHFAGNRVGLPEFSIASEVNEYDNVLERLEACNERLPKAVNFLVVDFWTTAGAVLNIVQEYNLQLGFATESPSASPSAAPSVAPSDVPSTSPSTTMIPSDAPSSEPTISSTALNGSLTPTSDGSTAATSGAPSSVAPIFDGSAAPSSMPSFGQGSTAPSSGGSLFQSTETPSSMTPSTSSSLTPTGTFAPSTSDISFSPTPSTSTSGTSAPSFLNNETSCGDGIVGSGVCEDASLCCSEFGYCGDGPEWCGE
jgi:hypothetical protein